MTPKQAIAMLDRQLARNGQTINLRRGADIVPVRAWVRGFDPEELVGGITQKDSKVILSPSGLKEWPGGMVLENDWAVIDGAERTVMAAVPVKLAGVLVRVEMQVKG